MANKLNIIEKTNFKNLEQIVKEYVKFFDNSKVPQPSDGMSYTDNSYDIEWNIGNVLFYGKSVKFLIEQKQNRQDFCNRTQGYLDRANERDDTSDEVKNKYIKDIEYNQTLGRNHAVDLLRAKYLFHHFVGQFVGIDVHDESSIVKMVNELTKHLDSKDRSTSKSPSTYHSCDIELKE
tara:strand:- start:263 stop:796 length:534 start_codon:yes stop_codon:yes gene_type:complete